MRWFDLLGIVLGVVMIVVILSQWYSIVFFKKKHRALEERMASLEEERRSLEKMIHSVGNERAAELIRQRAELLGRLLAAGVSGDSGQSDAVLQEIDRLVSERAEFMRQTRLIYICWQPEMIKTLTERGLTEEEIEICCLYALGLNGKAIQQYTRDGRHYQNVGVIRKKLGLGEHDRNIDGYIRTLLK